jgi:hypothetical protein
MNRLTASILAFSVSCFGFACSVYRILETNFLDVTGILQVLNVFNVLLGGTPASVRPQTADHGAVIGAFLFAILALFSFWWVVRELVRRYSGPQVNVEI